VRSLLPAASDARGGAPAAVLAAAAASGLAGDDAGRDPLALGELDPRSLTLARAGNGAGGGRAAASVPTAPGRLASLLRRTASTAARAGADDAAALFLPRQSRVTADADAVRLAAAAAALGAPTVADLRRRCLPGSPAFDPVAYLAVVHADTPAADLEAGREAAAAAAARARAALAALVRDNFSRFAACATTVRDVSAKL